MSAPATAAPHGRTTHAQHVVLAARLRRAGCVFAEEEAALLLRTASGAGDDPDRLEQLVRRREQGEPLEHLLGTVRFDGVDLAVGRGVFVPRVRTLTLAHRAIALARHRSVVVEAFAGVAPVAALVARTVPGTLVHATDVCPAARALARDNLPPDAAVHGGDVLTGLPAALRGDVDVLAAVPPYVPLGAESLLSHEARDHEPARALYGGVDGLDLVRRLLRESVPWLAPGGRLLVEIHRSQVPDALGHAAAVGLTGSARRADDGQTAVLELLASQGVHSSR
ncbi:N5-glutamine methyltransferase family protein [Jannaschia sp. R86511]|uniref:N5-glutamine methyltransferase family protein n=1 Tax=Jannaschia sp. R86511 TaxID=3093853 RepID=UPI0036D42496